MAWTDYSSTVSGSWSTDIGVAFNRVNFRVGDASDVPNRSVFITAANRVVVPIFRLGSLNVPGFDDGYQPDSTPDPIDNNIDQEGGGGGSTRPSNGFLYPRRQG